MSTDADLDRENVEMVKLNVKVPRPLLDELDGLATELDYPNRSEYVRAVLRDTVEPFFTPEAQKRVAEGYADLAAGRTVDHSEVMERFGTDDSSTQEQNAVTSDPGSRDSPDNSELNDPSDYVSNFCSRFGFSEETRTKAHQLLDDAAEDILPAADSPAERAAVAVSVAASDRDEFARVDVSEVAYVGQMPVLDLLEYIVDWAETLGSPRNKSPRSGEHD